MLDVRSFAVFGTKCDLLGNEQWKWLEEQLDDQTPVALTIVTSGIQVKIYVLYNCVTQYKRNED
jgi:hypothetical protein